MNKFIVSYERYHKRCITGGGSTKSGGRLNGRRITTCNVSFSSVIELNKEKQKEKKKVLSG